MIKLGKAEPVSRDGSDVILSFGDLWDIPQREGAALRSGIVSGQSEIHASKTVKLLTKISRARAHVGERIPRIPQLQMPGGSGHHLHHDHRHQRA